MSDSKNWPTGPSLRELVAQSNISWREILLRAATVALTLAELYLAQRRRN